MIDAHNLPCDAIGCVRPRGTSRPLWSRRPFCYRVWYLPIKYTTYYNTRPAAAARPVILVHVLPRAVSPGARGFRPIGFFFLWISQHSARIHDDTVGYSRNASSRQRCLAAFAVSGVRHETAVTRTRSRRRRIAATPSAVLLLFRKLMNFFFFFISRPRTPCTRALLKSLFEKPTFKYKIDRYTKIWIIRTKTGPF